MVYKTIADVQSADNPVTASDGQHASFLAAGALPLSHWAMMAAQAGLEPATSEALDVHVDLARAGTALALSVHLRLRGDSLP
jgi:hypothetical protein